MLSLEKKLPLLITGLAVIVLVGAAAIAVTDVRHAARLLAEERLQRVNMELAELVGRGVSARAALIDAAARDPGVRAVLAGTASPATAAPALAELRAAADSGAPVQLLNAQRRLVLELRDTSVAAPADGEAIPRAAAVSGFDADADESFYWIERPAPGAGGPAGWVRQQRRAGSPAAAETIGELIGPGVSIFLAHRERGPWVRLSGGGIPQPLTVSQPGLLEVPLGGRPHLARADTIAGVPWFVVSAMPLDAVQARSRALLSKLLLLGGLLLGLAVPAAWAISRGVTAPLRELARAADGIARGDYSVRARVRRTDELGRLATSFNDMADHVERARTELELASQAKSDFLATLSHEVRTPINAVIGYADLLDAGAAGTLEPRQHTYVERIRESGRHLTSVVDEVLDFSRIEAGGIELRVQAIPAADALRSAVALISAQAQAKHQEVLVEAGDGCRVAADVQRLRQVLINLLSNAVKFTPPHGSIQAACAEGGPPPGVGAASDDGRWVTITVRDSGPGIPPDQHGRIFEPFVQASGGYTREHGGTGLGLAISRRLTRLMGGDITVASVPGAGAAFTVWLPKAATPAHVPH